MKDVVVAELTISQGYFSFSTLSFGTLLEAAVWMAKMSKTHEAFEECPCHFHWDIIICFFYRDTHTDRIPVGAFFL